MTPSLQHEFSVEQDKSNLDLAFVEANTHVLTYIRDNIADAHLKNIPYSITLRDAAMMGWNIRSDRNYRYNFVADINIGG